jgi:hypothetical protein
MKRQTNHQIIMPFSEPFAEMWEIWKDYKWASHKFKYKSVFSEQAALEQLVTLSEGDEEKAIKIIKQSMRREWQGLFPLHETTTGNGKSKKSNSEDGQPSLRDQSAAEFARRNAERGQSSGGTNLKAV